MIINDIRYSTYFFSEYDKEKISDIFFKYHKYDLFHNSKIEPKLHGRNTINLFAYFQKIKLYDPLTYIDDVAG